MTYFINLDIFNELHLKGIHKVEDMILWTVIPALKMGLCAVIVE